MSDYIKNEDGSISGLSPGQFEFGERYVMCDHCHAKRPASALSLSTQKNEETNEEVDVVMCKDFKLCVRLAKHNFNNVQSEDET